MNRRVRSVANGAAVFLIVFGAQLTGPSGADAATDQLRDVGRTTYELLPGRHLVHVTITLSLTNKAPNTSRRHSCTQYVFDPYVGYIPYTTTCTTQTYYWYDGYWLWVEKDAKSLKVSADSGSASVKLGKRSGNYRRADIKFSNLYYRRTRHLTLSYDLVAGGPRSAATRRAGSGYASFCTAGPGTDNGSTRVIVPTGFQMSPSGSMSTTVAGRRTIFSTPPMAKPWTFYACFTGSNDTADVVPKVPGADGRTVTIQAWRDDPAPCRNSPRCSARCRSSMT